MNLFIMISCSPLGTESTMGAQLSTMPSNSPKEILAFTLSGVSGTIIGRNIVVEFPYGTDVTSLSPTIVYTGVAISPSPDEVQDFTDSVQYTVMAADKTIKVYTVDVVVATDSSKEITSFLFPGATGVISGRDIAVTVPFGTDVSTLIPTINHTGTSIVPDSGVAQDFTDPVEYLVTAADDSQQLYTVRVSVAANSAKEITAFSIAGYGGIITGTDISVMLPFGTDVSALIPTINHTGTSIASDSGVAQDFTDPVEYTVTAADDTTKVYTVVLSIAADTAKEITTFSILGFNGAISGMNISLTLPFGTDVTSLTPTIVHTGSAVSLASGVATDFTDSVQYTVTAEDDSTKVYTVDVSIAADTAKEITTFSILGFNGAISGTNISLTLPFGTDVTSLAPTIVHTGQNIAIASGVARNFLNPVQYTVTAADSTTKIYTVTVSVAANSAKEITTFSILGQNGAIVGTNIAVILPSGTDLSALTPTIVHTGSSVNPGTGVARNFQNPLLYTVTAADGTTKVYTVTATVSASSAKEITTFSILGINGAIVGTDIAVTLPNGTDVTSLTPTIIHTGASVNPASGMVQNFTNPISYTVTAADNSTKVFTVTVTVAANNAKEITTFSILGFNGAISGTNISVTLPFGTDLSSLTPTIVHTGASTNPASGVVQNFQNPLQYTVSAADNSTKLFTVTVSVAANSVKEITTFSILGINGAIVGTDALLTMPAGTDRSALAPNIIYAGASINPASGVVRNFTNPVQYTVTAADNTTKVYTITVANLPTAPAVTASTPTADTTPQWSWVGGGGGNGNYRFKIDDDDLTIDATTTAALSYTPVDPLSAGIHTLYVQERDGAGNWSESGSRAITIEACTSALSWGRNLNGQLGRNVTLPFITTPTSLSTLTNVTKVVGAGGSATVPFAIARKSDGTVWSWGTNDSGQLGLGNFATQGMPQQIPALSGVEDVAAGASFAIARDSDGAVWSWGLGTSNQVGDGTAITKLTPVRVGASSLGRPSLSGITKITTSQGASHSLAIAGDQTIWAWGLNTSAQLGDGTASVRAIPVQVGDSVTRVLNVSGVVATTAVLVTVTTTGNHNLEIGNRVVMAGWGGAGLDGTFNVSTVPTTTTFTYATAGASAPTLVGTATATLPSAFMPITSVTGNGALVTVTDGVLHGLVVGQKVQVVMAGWSGGAGVWNGTFEATATSTSAFTYVSNGNGTATGGTAILNGGTGAFSGAIDIAAGTTHSVALKSDGTVWAWGVNTTGQLGNNSALTSYYPTQVQVLGGGALNDVTAIAAGTTFSLARKSDGTLWAWGLGTSGQLGDNTILSKSYAVQVKSTEVGGFLTDVSNNISAGGAHAAVVKNDNTVWTWGLNTSFQLGDGTATLRNQPIQLAGVSDAAQVSAAFNFTLVSTIGNGVKGLGAANYSQLGIMEINSSTPLPMYGFENTPISDVSGGTSHSAVVRASDGSVWTAGLNTSNQLGYNMAVASITGDGALVTVTTSSAHRLSSGQSVVLAGWSGGSGVWNGTFVITVTDGDTFTYPSTGNGVAAGGTALATQSSTLVQVKDLGGSGFLTGVSSVRASALHTIALKDDGTVWGWGTNTNGRIGDNTATLRPYPVQVVGVAAAGFLTGVDSISAGTATSYARKGIDGSVYAWGLGTSGQLGDNTIVSKSAPVQVKGPGGVGNLVGITQISAGASHVLALKNDGTVWAWGLNTSGQLGDNTVTQRNAPVQVLNLTNVVDVSAGAAYSLAVKSNGTVWAWGLNTSYQLGDGTIAQRNQPVQVQGISGVSRVQAGETIAAFAVKSDGTVWGWGGGAGAAANNYGQIGDGTAGQIRPFPVQVEGIDHATKVAGGDSHAIAIQSCSY